MNEKHSETKEPMFVTWGRIYALCGLSQYGKPRFNKKRLQKLIYKFNQDLKNAKIEEYYFDQIPEHDCHASPEDGCEFCNEWYEQREVSSK